ncbi:hypothetical protein GCM10007939_25770 [Amylibacter marinus]|uniref:Peptidase M56 domain-containing protein n=1 Tax=Amylibacter marinus TaxID=1475483 RepID=A0ABQ5VXY0_9RHOB|nr:M56 family metallopeptidase [Amylibacter marinus]GLQ36293.1 hypothetical protein GCM10007939_25770 [Amylibacter marinus]
MSVEHFLDFYLHVNIIVLFAAFMLLLGTGVLHLLGYGNSYRSHLKLSTIILCTLTTVPLLHLMHGSYISTDAPSLSDVLVAQFLDGNINMSAVRFENLLSVWDRLMAEILQPTYTLTWVILGALVGIFAHKTYGIINSARHVVRIVRTAVTLRRIGRIHILTSDRITVPFTTRGLRHFYVVVPVSMLGSEQDLKIALGHELQHIRQGDITWEIGLELMLPFFFVNPGFWLLRQRIKVVREFACDREFLRRTGFDTWAYGACLINVARDNQHHKAQKFDALSVSFLGSKSGFARAQRAKLGRRIRAISATSTPQMSRLGLTTLVIPLVSAIILSTQVLYKTDGWSHDRIMLTTVINLERLKSRNTSYVAGLDY